ncbi:MAG: hypothetical protein J6033_03075, partial [Lachnospiraceae bacterium]|nr:hypothetical protein [Lachnospiraceae bacterium]
EVWKSPVESDNVYFMEPDYKTIGWLEEYLSLRMINDNEDYDAYADKISDFSVGATVIDSIDLGDESNILVYGFKNNN